MKTKHSHWTALLLCCAVILLSACKDDEKLPLSFYESSYEVPMDGIRYLGLESGNGDYSLEIENTRIASAGLDFGSTITGGTSIYVRGILTGTTRLRVTDYATGQSCVLDIKVTDNYEALRLLPNSPYSSPDAATLLPDIDEIYLVNNPQRDVYLFTQKEPDTAFTSGLKLAAKGHYDLQQGDDRKATLVLTFPEGEADGIATTLRFTMWGNSYVFHRLDKKLGLGWGTPPIETTRTSPTTPSYISDCTLEEIKEGIPEGEGRMLSYALEEREIPTGILP